MLVHLSCDLTFGELDETVTRQLKNQGTASKLRRPSSASQARRESCTAAAAAIRVVCGAIPRARFKQACEH